MGGMGILSVFADQFRSTFVYKSFSSGQLLPVPGIIDRRPEGGMSMFIVLEGCGWYTDCVFMLVIFFGSSLMYKLFSSELRFKRYLNSKFLNHLKDFMNFFY